MSGYKLPICWFGKVSTVHNKDGSITEQPITIDMVEPSCHCYTEMKAFFCMEGHMVECHVGKTCQEAECSHYEREEEAEKYDEEEF